MKKKEKSPAFQLYPKDLLTDTAWLSNEEFGVYVRLLLYAWIGLPGCAQGELPTSVEHLLRLTQLSQQDWERISGNLLPFFTQNGNGKMSQKRLMRELHKQVENRKNKQRAGLASATARQQKRNRESTSRSGSVATGTPTESNSSTASATSVIKKKKVERKVLTPEQIVSQLQAEPAYQGIAVQQEYNKAAVWCKSHNRTLTERFFVNWLNRIDRPVSSASSPGDVKSRFVF
jgi:uncharacterized protein YdaU (DUF1376 family)